MGQKKVTEKQIAIFNKKAPRLVEYVGKLAIVNDDSRQEIIEIGKGFQANIKTVDEYFKDDIKRADELHKSLTGKRMVLRNHYNDAITAIKAKIGVYDKKVADDKLQLELKEQAAEQAKRDRAIKAANEKITGLLKGVQDLAQQRDILTDTLEAGDCTDEAAEVMRSQITVLEEGIASKQDKVELATVKIEQAAPVSAPVSSAPKPTGYDIEITDLKALCEAIGAGNAPEGLISKVNEPDLKRFKKMGQAYPGVKYIPVYDKKRL